MNDTWWDGIDGDNVICHPGNQNEEGYEFACRFVTRIMPVIMLGYGIVFMYIAWIQLRLTRTVQPSLQSSGIRQRNSLTLPETFVVEPPKLRRKGKHEAVLAFVLAVEAFSTSLTCMVNGHGTVFASDTLPGRTGDAFYAIHYCTVWYLALIQVQGARHFNNVSYIPIGYGNRTRNKSIFLFSTQILDSLQGRFGPFLVFTFWILLTLQILPRGWFYFIGYVLTAIFGLRAFVAIVNQRVAALRKVALIENAARVTGETKKRRRGILEHKAFALMIDLTFLCIVTVLFPVSVVVFGSPFSSRQMLIHMSIMLPHIAIGNFIFAAKLYNNTNEAKKLKEQDLSSSFTSTPSTSNEKRKKSNGADSFSYGLSLSEQRTFDSFRNNRRRASLSAASSGGITVPPQHRRRSSLTS